jgi:hypothetical protein
MADLKISQLTGATTPLAGTEVLPIVQSSSTKKVSVANLTAGRDFAGNSLNLTAGLGVGVAPTSPLQVEKNGTATGLGTSTVAKLLDGSANKGFQIGYSDSTQKAIFLSNTTGATSAIGFWAYDAGGSGWAERLEISGPGNITFNTGNIVQGTAGKGINFTANANAPGMTSELLNWYEEGTWTPTFTNLTTVSGTPAPTGTYTRVGRTVYLTIYIPSGNTTSTANSTYCTNLPFAALGNHVCAASNASNVDSYGNGLIQGLNLFTPSWTNKINVIVSGTYIV